MAHPQDYSQYLLLEGGGGSLLEGGDDLHSFPHCLSSTGWAKKFTGSRVQGSGFEGKALNLKPETIGPRNWIQIIGSRLPKETVCF